MNVLAPKPWTQDEFFTWAERQEGSFEFAGFQPVAMTGGTVAYAIVIRNLHRALDARLHGTSSQPLGPDAGVATVDQAVRYPDALITCSKLELESRTVPGVIVAANAT